MMEGGEEEMGEGRRFVGGEGGVCGGNESKQQRSSGKWEIQCRGRGEGGNRLLLVHTWTYRSLKCPLSL